MGQQLHWGRHYLMVEPDHFRERDPLDETPFPWNEIMRRGAMQGLAETFFDQVQREARVDQRT